jgi:4-hydroxyphenylpyruvate dioxygenase
MQLPAGLTLAYDGLNNRRAPWDGEFPINEIVDVLRRSGALNTVGLEIFSQDFDRMTADEIGSVTKTVLDRALKI